jgi:hypothetical protein|tara:strand:- start:42 stop:260 length:219 start_codon:yes stop_codon:yes gene_type:complete
MIEIVMALLLVAQGSVLEHTYKAKLSDCLKSKRLAMREVNPQTVRFMCKEVKAETEIFMGAKKIVRIISMTK